jgi:hypothetical protein
MTPLQRWNLADLGSPEFVGVVLTPERREAVAAALAELDALRSAGDALAEAVRCLDAAYDATHYPDTDSRIAWDKAVSEAWRAIPTALSAWAAARGGSGADDGAEAAQEEGEDR